MKTIVRRMALPVAIAAGIGVTATAMQSVQQDPVAMVGAQAAEGPAVFEGAEALAQSFRSASRTALQGVVYVQVEAAPRQISQRAPQNPFEGTPFEDFFRFQQPSPGNAIPRSGSGSGFVISPDGYILTNNHVVDGASRVTVTLTDRSQYEAEVVGRDPNTDVAVLKIDAANLPVVRIGDSDAIEVGDWVLALGYPLSLGETVTAGIVSAKGKSIGIMSQNAGAAAPLEHFIQTDAAINPGNSGGPLVNLRGEAVGINSAIASPTGMYSGYGFAVPIKLAKRVADDLIRYGKVNRPRLAVEIANVDPSADVEVFGLPSADGAVVASLQDGPARSAGMRVGDVIVGVDGQPVRDTGDLMERIALRQPGERVTLDVIRYGKRERIPVTLGAFESEAAPVRTAAAPSRDSLGQLGFAATELTPALARELNIRSGNGGVVVTQVDRAGPAPARLAGLRLQNINGQEIRSIEDLREVAGKVGPGSVVSVVGLTPDGEQRIVNYRIR